MSRVVYSRNTRGRMCTRNSATEDRGTRKKIIKSWQTQNKWTETQGVKAKKHQTIATPHERLCMVIGKRITKLLYLQLRFGDSPQSTLLLWDDHAGSCLSFSLFCGWAFSKTKHFTNKYIFLSPERFVWLGIFSFQDLSGMWGRFQENKSSFYCGGCRIMHCGKSCGPPHRVLCVFSFAIFKKMHAIAICGARSCRG